jgi:alpha-galactosidase
MHGIIGRLVTEFGVGYFKFDYNIEVTQGTDINCSSPGSGQLDHNRAYLAWVNELHDRFPDLVIENCSSGAQRMDYAMLATHALQSTSDQQDPDRYAAISAALPTAVTPEQGATWAYPQPEWDDETNALTVVNSLLGRIHLSGRLDILSPHQFNIIKEGMDVYRSIRGDLPTANAFWPLGLPHWHDDWLALGMAAASGDRFYVAVWRRGGADSVELPVPALKGKNVRSEFLYPVTLGAETDWRAAEGVLRVKVPSKLCARLFRLTVL